jgi:hypothetical protein
LEEDQVQATQQATANLQNKLLNVLRSLMSIVNGTEALTLSQTNTNVSVSQTSASAATMTRGHGLLFGFLLF